MNLVDIMFVCVNIKVDFDVLEKYIEDKNERKMTFKHYYVICQKTS